MCYILDICIHTHKDISCVYIGIYSSLYGETASPRSESKPFAFYACCKVHSGQQEQHHPGVLHENMKALHFSPFLVLWFHQEKANVSFVNFLLNLEATDCAWTLYSSHGCIFGQKTLFLVLHRIFGVEIIVYKFLSF